MRYVLLIAAVLAVPVRASGPNEPLGDCSDWVMVMPGITCTEVIPWPCTSAACDQGNGTQADNAGGIFGWRQRIEYSGGGCGSTWGFRTEIVLFRNGADETIAYIDDRCESTPATYERTVAANGLTFDEENGKLYFAFGSDCGIDSCPFTKNRARLIAFESFTTTFEILQTYVPTANAISFHVPYMPEGMQYADYFDTYTGDLATVGDWSQLQPLQCGYPATAPNVGDYLTVADTLPTPGPGAGRYYLTVANHQGNRRFGRKMTDGVLSGRDTAALPACP